MSLFWVQHKDLLHLFSVRMIGCSITIYWLCHPSPTDLQRQLGQACIPFSPHVLFFGPSSALLIDFLYSHQYLISCDFVGSLGIWWSRSPARFFLRRSWTLPVPLLFHNTSLNHFVRLIFFLRYGSFSFTEEGWKEEWPFWNFMGRSKATWEHCTSQILYPMWPWNLNYLVVARNFFSELGSIFSHSPNPSLFFWEQNCANTLCLH